MNDELKLQMGKFFSNRYCLFIILNSAFIIFLASCSIEKQISKSANETVLTNKALVAAHVGISIYEPAANKYWFNYQGDKYFVPASNTKIPTCYAAMKYLGDSLVGFRYQADDTTIYILPTGDPSFLHEDFSSSRAIELLKKFNYVSLLSNNFFSDKWGSGWSWSDYSEGYMAERSSFPIYGNVAYFSLKEKHVIVRPAFFQKLIVNSNTQNFEGFRVTRSIESNDFIVYKGNQKTQTITFSTGKSSLNLIPTVQAEILSDALNIPVLPGLVSKIQKENYITFHSQPTDSLLKPMMHRSDNFFAEQSLLMVSNEKLGYMSDDKIIDTLLKTDLKDLPQKPRWVDGSGLSRYNLFTPQDFVSILNKMQNEFGMERIKVILATGGEGTISSYYKADSGYIYGKTGTLSGVVAFSGYLYTKKGKLLIFSTLINNHQASATDVRKAIEKFLQGIRERF